MSDLHARSSSTVMARLRAAEALLGPSERRVATLAAEGRSNRDIAQTLFLSVKTVEGHLSHVYTKLDVDSRKQLAAALRA